MSRKKSASCFRKVNEVVKRPVSCYICVLQEYHMITEFATMKITAAEVEHVAQLARLELSAEEKSLFVGQMDAILGYVDKLKELSTDDVQPTSHAIPVENAFRPDREAPSIGVEKALANAPDRAESFYRVPKVIE